MQRQRTGPVQRSDCAGNQAPGAGPVKKTGKRKRDSAGDASAGSRISAAEFAKRLEPGTVLPSYGGG